MRDKEHGRFKVVEKTKLTIVPKVGTCKEAAEALTNCLEQPCKGIDMRHHLFNATWENRQFTKCKQALTNDSVLAVYDFARNYTTITQDEVKSNYYSKKQITLHPIPLYYLDPVTGEMTHESFVVTSDDLTHDADAVDAFRRAVLVHLEEV